MHRPRRRRLVATRQLVLALGAGLDHRKAVGDGVVDGLVVAELEVEERHLARRAPVAAIEPVAPDKAEGAGNGLVAVIGEHQDDAPGHGGGKPGEEAAGEVGAAPLAAAGVLIEVEERVPDGLGEVGTGQPADFEAIGKSLGLTTDQSAGAIGSYLGYAQEKLPAADYSKVAATVPGAEGYVQKAKDLGAVTGPISDVSGLNSAFGKLGISPEAASKVTPAITNYIGKAGGSTVQGLLSGILK